MSMVKKILIVLAVGLLVPIVYYFKWFNPTVAEIDELTMERAEAQRKYESQKKIADDLPRFNREIEQLRDALLHSIQQLPNKKNVPELLERFATLAQESGVRISRFSLSPEATKGFYVELPINMELTGGFHNIAVYFDKIGKEERIINVKNVAVRNPRVEDGETLVTVTCLATTYRFLEAEAAR